MTKGEKIQDVIPKKEDRTLCIRMGLRTTKSEADSKTFTYLNNSFLNKDYNDCERKSGSKIASRGGRDLTRDILKLLVPYDFLNKWQKWNKWYTKWFDVYHPRLISGVRYEEQFIYNLINGVGGIYDTWDIKAKSGNKKMVGIPKAYSNWNNKTMIATKDYCLISRKLKWYEEHPQTIPIMKGWGLPPPEDNEQDDNQDPKTPPRKKKKEESINSINNINSINSIINLYSSIRRLLFNNSISSILRTTWCIRRITTKTSY